MKYRIYALALLLLHASSQAENISGKSVFVDFVNYDLYSTTGYNLIVNQQHEKGHVLNEPEVLLSLFYGESTNHADLNKYFLFDNKTELVVKENIPTTAVAELSQDLFSQDFNLQTFAGNYHSILKFKPKQTSLGFVISARYPFHERYWVSIDLPFLHLNQNLNLEEIRISDESTAYGTRNFKESNGNATRETLTPQVNMYEAFRQPGLEYGRIDGAQKKDGLADIKIHVGRNAYNREDLFVSQYVGIIIPTGNRRTAKYMWEPIVGNGHHVGVDWGNTTHICMHEASLCNWWITNALTGQYLFENTQKRSLDLFNGPWTRYLAMYKDASARSANTLTFGINSMTQDVKINPGVAFHMATQLSLVGENWNINFGIINRFRQAEEIELAEQWKLGPMIANIAPVAGAVVPSRKMGRAFNSTAMIAGGGTPADLFIQESDINLLSAAHTNVFANTLHASVAYFNDGQYSQNYEIGGSYDVSRQNTGIERWSLFGKVLINF